MLAYTSSYVGANDDAIRGQLSCEPHKIFSVVGEISKILDLGGL